MDKTKIVKNILSTLMMMMLKIFSNNQYIFHSIIMSEILYIYTRIVHQRMLFSFHEHFQIQTATVPPKNM